MKALTTLKSALNQGSAIGIAALIGLLPVIIPQYALAAELQTLREKPAEVFEIKITDSSLLEPKNDSNQTTNSNSISFGDITQSDPLVISLDAYLEAHDSPLAGSAGKLVTGKHWERALGISLVESSMCVHTPKVKTKNGWVESYNCSGIGGDNYHIYTSYLDWFDGMNNLLDQPNYINRPIEKFVRYYVQPGSASWIYGVKKTESELAAMEADASIQRRQLAQKQIGPVTTALATFSENTN